MTLAYLFLPRLASIDECSHVNWPPGSMDSYSCPAIHHITRGLARRKRRGNLLE